MCVAVDGSGDVLTSATPTAGLDGWFFQTINHTLALDAVACLSNSLCLALDQHGFAVPGTFVPGFLAVPGAATDIAMGARSGPWITGTSAVKGGHPIYRFTGSNWAPVPGGAVTIAVDPAGNAWIINAAHTIYHWNGRAWIHYAGAATDISVGANGAVWIVGAGTAKGGHPLYQLTGSSWTLVPGGAVTIGVDTAGNPWVINNTNTIYHRSGGGWIHEPGAATDISVGGDGSVWATGITARPGGFPLFRWTGRTWAGQPGIGVTMAVDPGGFPAVLDLQHDILAS
jgi:hypothetical protein